MRDFFLSSLMAKKNPRRERESSYAYQPPYLMSIPICITREKEREKFIMRNAYASASEDRPWWKNENDYRCNGWTNWEREIVL